MLAALPSSSYGGPDDRTAILHDPNAAADSKLCPGCQTTVLDDNGGVVIAFGQSFFHVDCFKCAKCHDKVTADTNLLLLSDGQPICSNCSYSCSVCHQPILDEAIMTGDDSYHAHCFMCKACHNRIDELMFAKTSHGIYCMNCHNERVARSERHAQKQRELKEQRERELKERPGTSASASASGSSKSREHAAREHARGNGAGSPASAWTPSSAHPSTSAVVSPPSSSQNAHAHTAPSRAATLPLSTPPNPPSPGPPVRRQSVQSTNSDQQKNGFVSSPAPVPETDSRSGRNTPSSQPPSVAVTIPPSEGRNGHPSSHPPSSPTIVSPSQDTDVDMALSLDYYLRSSEEAFGSSNSNLLALPGSRNSLQRRKSYDDGVRPLGQLAQKPAALNGDGGVPGLHVPSKGLSNRSKRQSINPGMPFKLDLSNVSSSQAQSTPDSASYGRSSPVNGRGSPHLSSPLRERPANERGALYQNLPPVRPRAESSSTYLPEHPKPKPSPLNHLESDGIPPRSHSLTANVSPNERTPDRASPVLGLPSSIRPQRSFDERTIRPSMALPDRRAVSNSLSIDVEKSRGGSGNRSHPTSPAHRVDVPQNIESGTDTEAEGDNNNKPSAEASDDDEPPVPPPKETKPRPRPDRLHLESQQAGDDVEEDVSRSSSADTSDGESSPVERISHSTFIAPALPPIRFSMGGGDFADLLQSVTGQSSLKSLDRLAQLSEDTIARLDRMDTPPLAKTPPPTAASEGAWQTTPAGDSTFTPATAPSALADDASEITVEASSAPSSNFHTESSSDGHRESVSSSSSLSPDEPPPAPKAGEREPEAISRQTSSGSSVSAARRPLNTAPTLHGRSSSDLDRDARAAAAAAVSPLVRHRRLDSGASLGPDASVGYEANAARITVTAPGSTVARPLKYDASDLVTRRLQEALHEASKRGAMHVNLDKEFVQAILMVVEQRKVENAEMKGKLDGMKRASQQYIDGLTVAQGEYDRELRLRRDAEAEVTRLRVLLAGQAARIIAMSNESRKGELHKQITRELSDSLSGLERDVSKLRVERDVTLAEMDELASSKSSSSLGDNGDPPANLSRSLTMRLDKLKTQYQRELIPLTDERGALLREVAELKAARDVFLEETTMLNARNEELAQLNALYARRNESSMPENTEQDALREKKSGSFDRQRPPMATIEPSNTVLTTNSIGTDESADSSVYIKVSKTDAEAPPTLRGKLRWPGRLIKETTPSSAVAAPEGEKPMGAKHVFQQISLLRFTRCDYCSDKLWGSQVRCSACSYSVHPRCLNHVVSACTPQATRRDESASAAPLPPSMFGRDLIEQVRADSKGADRMVPVIVEKCIDAVENSALEYEGIYRKTGGSGQSKIITQLFERGDYTSFDLRDQDKFNDICSITSVLKTYFRSLPNPLMTYALHDEFMHASTTREPAAKSAKYADLVSQLPTEHYYTVRLLMLHLHRIYERSDVNLMTARNLGVVFGPTLMRSRDPAAEFSDMAGKALSVEWLVLKAPEIFPPLPNEQH